MKRNKTNPIRTTLNTPLAIGFALLLVVSLWLAAMQWPGVSQAQDASEMVGTTETLAVDSIFRHGSSLAIDSRGRPHISYVETGYRTLSSRLRYAVELEPGLWRFEVLTNWGGQIDATSLVLDDADNPHIGYMDIGRLMYAKKIDGSWQFEEVNGAFSSSDALEISLALVMILDSDGQPHIASTGSGIEYARRTEQGWQTAIVTNYADSRYITLALDKADRPHLGFMREYMDPAEVEIGNLYYAYLEGDSWQIERVDFGGGGWYPTLVLDSTGRAHFSYQSGIHTEFGNDLKLSYAQRSAAAPAHGEWQLEQVAERSDGESMLLMSDDGHPHISYSASAYRRMYATKYEADWQKMEVDYRFGECISDELWSLDSIGRPVLACINEGMELITWSPMPKYLLWMPVIHRP